MWDVVDLGLLKMDFLGLRNLDVIDKAVDLVGGVDIGALTLDDAKTYEMLARGDSSGVFQFESSGMRDVRPAGEAHRVRDLIALVALYRPGPMGYIPTYAARKNGREQVSFADPRLEAITGQTYAICIYQEQYMRIGEGARRVLACRGGDAAQGDRQEDPRAHGVAQGQVPRGLRREHRRAGGRAAAVEGHDSGDYSFNRRTRRATRSSPTGRRGSAEPPRGSTCALISSVMNTKDRVPSTSTPAATWESRCCRPT